MDTTGGYKAVDTTGGLQSSGHYWRLTKQWTLLEAFIAVDTTGGLQNSGQYQTWGQIHLYLKVIKYFF